MTETARRFKYNPTVNLHRRERSRVPLPPRHERRPDAGGFATQLLPERRRDGADAVRVPENPAPGLEAPRRPPESNFDRLWRCIVGVNVGWFDGEDNAYLIFWYDLAEPFHDFRPKGQALSIRIEGPAGKVTLAADPSGTWADGRTLYLRTDFERKAAGWLESDREAMRVVLARKTPAPTAKSKRPRREIGFTPGRARHVPRLF